MTAVRVFSVLLGLGLVACAGAAPDDVLGPVTSKSSAKAPAAKTPAGATGGAGGVAGAPASPGAPAASDQGAAGQDGNGQGDPGQPTMPVFPGAPVHPDIPPPPGGTITCVIAPEVSSPEQATTFSSCVTGTLSGNHGNSFVRIVAPDASRTMVVSHEESAPILYRVGAEDDSGTLGLPVQLNLDTSFTDGDQEIRVSPGTAYLFRLTAMNGDANGDPTFQINVQFTTRH